MNKVIVATATFILGALVGFSFQTVTAQEQIDESSIWDIYRKAIAISMLYEWSERVAKLGFRLTGKTISG